MSDDKVIDFLSAKEPHVHSRKEQKVKDMRQRFEAYLPTKPKPVAKKKSNKRKKNKRKK
ncbi:tRNA (uracil-5-)-methyltransferase [Spartinivicinus ruber]|uniref:tRNA (uracil-5-)-methyltransferase n=1 Tax=Spartinivicinus ruber TaxID=2683272 RepID=UPI0013D28015|nr:tRNA (uracil-5-)-methyltransferase [Spartinivicinus ruber]